MRVTVVQSRDHILNTYAEKISQYAESRFKRSDIQIITNARSAPPRTLMRASGSDAG